MENGTKQNKWITLNVGGTNFTTTKATLQKDAKSFLARLASCSDDITELGSDRDQNGAYLIDRSPILFEHVLNYLRTNKLIYETQQQLQAILLEAEFYNLQGLIKTCRQQLSTNEQQHGQTAKSKPPKTAYRVLMCSELDLTTTLASLSDGWKFEQVTSLKINDDGGNRCPGQSSGNEFLLVLSRQSTHPDQLNLHQGKKIEKYLETHNSINSETELNGVESP